MQPITLEQVSIQPINTVTAQPTSQIDPILYEQCRVLINNDFKNEIENSINARLKWQKLNKVLDVASHIFQGTTTILAFISAATKFSDLSILAGCTGVCAGISMSYSQYCKTQYKNLTTTVETMSRTINLPNILPDNSLEMNNADNRRPNNLPIRQPRPILTSYNNSTNNIPITSCLEIPSLTTTTTSTPVYTIAPTPSPA